MLLSLIIPVYNRREEMRELLKSLSLQTDKNFEIIIVEDGSSQRCEQDAAIYAEEMDITYHFKPNTGRSDTRNVGASLAKGDYMIFFDSDCIIPPGYVQAVISHLQKDPADAFGGPDAAHASFNDLQKAISHSMTCFFTTGGIRGGKKQMEKFRPRSFNMGISRKVYETIGGFRNSLGEDIDFSIRIEEAGFRTILIREAFVYHKRRVSLKKFYHQVNTFGQARIHLYKQHPTSLKAVHLAPAIFTLGLAGIIILSIFYPLAILLPALYFMLIFTDSLIKNRSLKVALLSIITGFIQLTGYGMGFLKATWQYVILGNNIQSIGNVENLYKKDNK